MSNYGWAIVLITILINMVMFPLKVKSMRAMQKMQKVAPEIKTIQERYKKYSMRDPRKAEMNKEVMAVYSREGINPLGVARPRSSRCRSGLGCIGCSRIPSSCATPVDRPDSRSFGPLSVLHFAGDYGRLDVLHAEDDADAGDGSRPAKMMAMTPLIFGGMFLFPPAAWPYIY